MKKPLILTGGTGGLGTVVVEQLSRTYQCILLRRPQTDLADASSVRGALRDAVREHGAPYGLVHMAGGWAGGTVPETTDETFAQMLELNLLTSFHAIRETLAVMNRNEPGRIVAISSIATLRKDAASAAYTISKTALNTLIELTAAELAGTRITVNALLPAAPVHGHFILLSFVGMTLFGLVYRSLPAWSNGGNAPLGRRVRSGLRHSAADPHDEHRVRQE